MIPVGTLCYIRNIAANVDRWRLNGRTCEVVGALYVAHCDEPSCRTLHSWYRCRVPSIEGLFGIAPDCLVPITPPGRQTITVKRERARA